MVEHAKITRIDFTVDVLCLDINELIVIHHASHVENHYAEDGSMGSKYLNFTTEKHFLIYDKKKQMKKVKKMQQLLPDQGWTRIEYMLRKPDLDLKKMTSLPNPFSDLQLIAYPGANGDKVYNPTWQLFLSACRFEGVEKALAYFSEADRVHYKTRLLTEGRSEWWKPEQIWQGLAAAINTIMTPKGYAPKHQHAVA